MYYDTESPLTSDFEKLARRCIVDDADRAAMRDVLNEFFILKEDGYHNTRADREIDGYKRMAEGGRRGAYKRWGKANDSHPIATPSQPHGKANANHEPLTINQEPKTNTNKPKSAAPPFVLPDWINRSHWDTWHSTAKRKKATPAQKQMALDKLAAWREAGEDFAGALENAAIGGNQGLFLPSKPFAKTPAKATEPAWRTEQRNRTIQAVPNIAENHIPATEFFEIEAKNVTSIAMG